MSKRKKSDPIDYELFAQFGVTKEETQELLLRHLEDIRKTHEN